MIRRFISLLRVSLLMLCVVALSLDANAAVLTISRESNTLVLSGLTPGGKAVLFGVQKFLSPRGDFETSRRYVSIEEDIDGDGIVFYSPDPGISTDAVWSGTDLATGAMMVFIPAGFQRESIPLPGRGLHRGVGGVLNQLSTSLRLIEVLVVRPGKGAWVYTAGEGGSGDDGPKHDGKIDLKVDRFSPIVDGDLLKHFSPHDTLIIIDIPTMRYHFSQVSE